jgi:BirA family biotin operon repressor/biotin-[acetyl-CoA-carboxylase] ligase
MKLPRAQAVASTLLILPEVASTNDALRAEVAQRSRAGQPTNFTVVVSPHQTAGRGRLGRVWSSPAGATLAISVAVAPSEFSDGDSDSDASGSGSDASSATSETSASGERSERGTAVPSEQYGWFPLLAGVAMARAVIDALAGAGSAAAVGIKWPNDIQIGGAKVAGILTELIPETGHLIVGVGINLAMTPEQLPVPTATSLAIEGATAADDNLADAVLAEFLTQLRTLVASFVANAGEATTSGISEAVTTLCTTIGSLVRVEFPDGGALVGLATGIDSTGRLMVRNLTDGAIVAVAAGDVTHLRYE